MKALSAEWALSRDFTAAEIERSLAALLVELPPLVDLLLVEPPLLALPLVEPLAVEPLLVDALPVEPPPAGVDAPPERAAPPSMATAQPDSIAAAIIPATQAAA